MPQHKMCPACGSDGSPVLSQEYRFQVCCKNTQCRVRGPSQRVIAEAWVAWDDPGWRTPSKDLEKLQDKLELASLKRDEWRDRYEELLASRTLKS